MATPADRVSRYRWLHDKFERGMAQEESRMSGWAQVFLGFNTAVAAAVLLLLTQFDRTPTSLWAVAAVAVIGSAGCACWFALGHRMHQNWMTWRQMALALEEHHKGEGEELLATVAVYWTTSEVDLNSPISAVSEISHVSPHDFSPVNAIVKHAPRLLTVAWAAVAVAAGVLAAFSL
jgi:hypothetical protein